jgi:hypothetical protein
MMAPSQSTVVVRNLPSLTTVDDVKTFFDTRIRGADAFVFPLVQDTQRPSGNFKCTIVTLYSAKKNALGLNGQDFIAKAGSGITKIQIDATFIGSITLAEHDNPQFE